MFNKCFIISPTFKAKFRVLKRFVQIKIKTSQFTAALPKPFFKQSNNTAIKFTAAQNLMACLTYMS